MTTNPQKRSGLILLVVLGMLSLFSLLAVSFMVVSSQSRRANAGRASRDFRGTAPEKLLDSAVRPVLRGTTDRQSVHFGHDLLGDIYGQRRTDVTLGNADFSQELRVRRFRFGGTSVQPLGSSHAERPILIANRFLRIPIVSNNQPATAETTSDLPLQNDAWTSRIVTFVEGPLRGQSFRIVRYMGGTGNYVSATPEDAAQVFSITIDLQDAEDRRVAVGGTTRSLAEWIRPTGAATAIDGLQLCYPAAAINGSHFGAQPSLPPIPGYRMLVNSAPYGSFGSGIAGLLDNTGTVVNSTDPLQIPNGAPTPSSGIADISEALQPFSPSRNLHVGDTNESWDAADFQNMWLSHTATNPQNAAAIIPSYHRPALINYLANWDNPINYSRQDLIYTCQRLIRATGRPLSIRIRRAANTPPDFVSNPSFSGSAAGGYSQLDCIHDDGTLWSGGEYLKFVEWARWLCGSVVLDPSTGVNTSLGWDVDTNHDGLRDAVWTDPHLPLTTSREGKLLKVLAAYTIESLDSRLDLAATGNLAQLRTIGMPANDYASGNGNFVPQGTGFGSAETSMRHLFVDDAAYLDFLRSRYGGDDLPGRMIDDFPSRLHAFGRRPSHSLLNLPGLPNSDYGWTTFGLDVMGNPRIADLPGNNFSTNDPYESRWLHKAAYDEPLTIAEWENLLRPNDWDRSSLAGRSPSLDVSNPIARAAALRSITPRSRHLRTPARAFVLAQNSSGNLPPIQRLSAYRELEALYGLKYSQSPPTGYDSSLTLRAWKELFPFEIARGEQLDLNRPMSNGVDDDVDGQIDEPNEEFDPTGFQRRGVTYNPTSASLVTAEIGEYLPTWHLPRPTSGTIGIDAGGFDPLYEALPAGDAARLYFGVQTRQLMARNLYCLGMLVLPEELHQAPKTAAGTGLTGDDRARVIAQWAVNVVDFRDADSTMTRFPYDRNPFSLTGGQYWNPEPNTVVWGHEAPEVALTESLATHDVRVIDSEDDDGIGTETTDPLNPDPDMDQYRLPEGSLFLELLCLRTTHSRAAANANETDQWPQAKSAALYDSATSQLDLGRMTPATVNGNTVTQYPVFRLAISEPHPSTPAGPGAPQTPDINSPLGILSDTAGRGSVTYQIPNSPSSTSLVWDTNGARTAPNIDRIVVFRKPGTGGLVVEAQTFPDFMSRGLSDEQVRGRVFTMNPTITNPNTDHVTLAGGEYLVVGPREITYFGSNQSAATSRINSPNAHRIVMESVTNASSGTLPVVNREQWASLYTSGNVAVDNARAAMRNTKLMVASQPVFEFDAMNNQLQRWGEIGLNVSAPYGVRGPMVDGYYPRPTQQVSSTDATGDPAVGAPGFQVLPADGYRDFGTMVGTLPDQPFDSETYAPLQPLANGPDNLPQLGTQANWCTAFMQRLADPERPWHADFNPYITIDWIPIDLTIFSGEEQITDQNGQPVEYSFASRQKSGAMVDATGTNPFLPLTDPGRSFHSYAVTELPQPAAAVAGGNANFTATLRADPGSGVGRPSTTAAVGGASHFTTLGYLNSTFGLSGETGGSAIAVDYVGAPSVMPAALYWPDRDYSNPLELTLVPFSAPGQLGQEFSAPATSVTANASYSLPQAASRFTHLFNYFQPGNAPNEGSVARLLDLIQTKSAWADSEEFIPATSLAASATNTALQNDAIARILRPLRTPENRLSEFVEPGRVNINDISEPDVLQGLLWNQLPPTTRSTRVSSGNTVVQTVWDNFLASRGGGATAGGGDDFLQVGHLDSRFPTRFAGVFKDPASAGMVPPTRDGVLDRTVFSAGGTPTPTSPVNTTLLRGTVVPPGGTPTPPTDQFFRTDYSPYNGTALQTRHPVYDHLPFTRLSNLTTTRSNVFSVRVTLGYFEFDSVTGIGREYGIDEGTDRRHSAFYVIDRSIPVGYRQGLDLNTDKCILMRRIIE
ncbi:MAG TPA: hypothetical protein DDW52_26285 [Planctomycetaceae bacterium]|nr:hypothetical protein [Planctomycetaceae bacterium]